MLKAIREIVVGGYVFNAGNTWRLIMLLSLILLILRLIREQVLEYYIIWRGH